jgi:hypothetical protein
MNATPAKKQKRGGFRPDSYEVTLTPRERSSLYAMLLSKDTRYLQFNTYTDTTVTDGTYDEGDGGHPFSRTDWWNYGPGQLPSSTSDIVVSQVWPGQGKAFLILATGFTLEAQGGQNISVEGCTFTPPLNSYCGSLIVTLPQPNINLGYDCDEYIFAPVGPNTAQGQYPNLTALEAALVNNRGPNWNPNQICGPGTGDPFA